MAVLKHPVLAAALPLAAACYTPDLRDCTVSCASAADCADGQVCGRDRFCAAPDVAGTCGSPDAGIPIDTPADAPPDAIIDATTPVALHITIEGRGKVSGSTIPTCDGASGQADCIVEVARDVALTIHAMPRQSWQFVAWESACAGQSATCTITPTSATAVKARFEELD